MTQLVFDRDDFFAQWAETAYPACAPLARPLTTIGMVTGDGAAILGAAVFHNFRGHDVEVTLVCAGPRWATPGNVRAILHYPFKQLKVKRLTAITSKTNKRARRLLTGLGFHLEGVHPYAGSDGRAAITYGMYHDDARKWLDGKEEPLRADAA